MGPSRFDIRFSGELEPGTDPLAARQRLQEGFGLSDAAAERLFSGRTVTVKQSVDRETAVRYRERFREAGARIEIVPVAGLAREVDELAARIGSLEGGQGAHVRRDPLDSVVETVFHYFEKTLAGVLLILVSLVSVFAVVELCVILYRDLVSHQSLLLSLDQLFELFGMFLTVLIAIELMASIYMYVMDKSVHVEFMLLIAITALTRKVVVMDLESKADEPMYLIGLAALLGILVGGYYLVRGQFAKRTESAGGLDHR
ncbi:phosphate-starvation-inducible PsiE family protein [Thiococcus pfennigii]|uniref:phosphate-starvation-inducible PsiE family protein n=1 Tax=Thiococcus pfennigii TaxID=1057 RepID=UPI001905320A|nr:phosphate-starvation-inducible PsiE family protein [Thiococcus pfennigii]MBK1701303.1 hypothetical protein [Thiococcus pfennigii]